LLVLVVMAVMRAQRPMLRLPAGLGPRGSWSPVLLVLGIAASMVGLARLAIAGFAPGGHLPVLVLTACAAGLLATLFTAAPRPKKPGRKRSALRHRTSRPKPPKPGIPIRGAYHMAGAPASSRYSKGASSTRRAPP
jgi:hypothetical protein